MVSTARDGERLGVTRPERKPSLMDRLNMGLGLGWSEREECVRMSAVEDDRDEERR